VLYASGDEHIEAIHTATGRVIWTLPLKNEAASAPAIVRRTLAVPISNALLFVDARTGATQTRWDPGQGVCATPTAVGRSLYVLSNLGVLYALSLGGEG
jgi:hypothetical protein